MLSTNRSVVFCQLLIIVLIIGFVQYTAQAESLSESAPRTLQSASELEYPPFALVRPDGNADGFSVDLLKAVTQAMGLQINIVVGPWHEIKQKLIDGQIDVLPLASYSQERDKVLDFTVPYLRMHGTIFVRKGESSIRNEADLKGKEVIVMRGDTAHEYVLRKNLSDNLILTDSYAEAMNLLSAGKHDAVVVQQLVGLQLLKQLEISNVVDIHPYQYMNLKPSANPLSDFEQKFCIAVKEGDRELLSLLNEGLSIVIANGSYDRLYAKWFSPILPHPPVPLSLLIKSVLVIAVPVLLLLAVLGLWYLKRQVAVKTRKLNNEVNERKRTAEDLQQSQTQLQSIFRAAPTGIGLAVDRVIKKANSRLCDMLGYAKEELIDQNARLLYLTDEDHQNVGREKYEQIRRNGTGTVETRWIHKNGRILNILLSSTPIDLNDLSKGVTFTALDITERKKAEKHRLQLERQVQHAQKLESLGVLAGGIAHDFNNILMTIIGNADIALADMSRFSPVRGNIQEIEKAAHRAADLAKQMLAFSGKGKFVIEPIDINELVSEMSHMLEVTISKKIVLKLNFAENLPQFDGDATQIRQVLLNLLLNASEAIGDHSGIVTLSTDTMDCDRGYLDTTNIAFHAGLDAKLPEGVYICVEVADTGCGMSPETQEKMFDPFFTTKFTGRGLGMAAVLGIIRGHKGAIKIYSEPNKGTTIKVLFPAAKTELQKPVRIGNDMTEQMALCTDGTVLIADDEASVCAVGKLMLERMGFKVITAYDGQEAVDVFRGNAADIVCVLLDLTMPRLNGEKVFSQLRRIKPKIKVILSSGYNEQEATQRFAGKGLAGFIQKPYTSAVLRTKIRQIMETAE